jgi:hypothetical protein
MKDVIEIILGMFGNMLWEVYVAQIVNIKRKKGRELYTRRRS